jgi:hypothetical protein
MSPSRKKLAVTLVSVAAVLAVGLVVRRGRAPAPPPSVAVAGLAVPEAPTSADRDPSFPTGQQARTYYGAVVQGERNALGVVSSSLARIRANGGDPQQLAQLERLRVEYSGRLKRHEAKLAEVRADP